jgi:D-alanyl-D-alanine carboxypeptidase (penicillin-binding protein 5/6)
MFEPARRIFLMLALSLTALAATFNSPALAAPGYATSESKYAAIVLDAKTGEVLYAKNADSARYPASITKIMTLYLAFDALSQGRLKASDTITVSQHAASMAPSHLGLRPGETISVDNAIRAITVHSANDMAVALAEKVGGSEGRFATLMTLRAQELGMTGTHYVNASGLPDARQITTARDIATLSRAVMRDFPQYYSYFSLHEFEYHGQTMVKHGLLGKLDGLKTGFTNASGFNLAATAAMNNNRLIAVMLGGNTAVARDRHVETLLNTGFEVLRRRQAGDKVTLAELMNEPDPVGPMGEALTEQGSNDQLGAKIATAAQDGAAHPIAGLNDNPRPAKLMLAKADHRDAIDKPQARRAQGDFVIQVGAFRRKDEARAQLTKISRKFGDHIDDGKSEVTGKAHGRYSARFVGLTESQAKDACRALSAHRQSCKVMTAG